MKNLLKLLLFFTTSIIAQEPIDSTTIAKKEIKQPIDSITTKNDSINKLKNTLFTDADLKIIDSLLVEEQFNAPIFDSIQYVINDKDIIGDPTLVLSSELLKTRLSKIDVNTPFHLAYNPSLEQVINGYLKRRRKYYPALMARAQYYFPMFERYLDQYNIPLEMKYLAIVESALKPRAKSRVGATGLWQFMYGTGVQVGLKVSSYVDERQDPVKSTIAACKYLNQLYKIFGDWDLALAAYNSGPGNVSKAIKRSGGYKNYWNIRPYLPRETAGYVPAFYATMYIFEYAKEHKLYPEAPKIFHFETDTIKVKKTVSFDQISETTGIDTELLSFLNPEYKLDIIPLVKDRKYVVRLPRNKVIDFLEKENDLYALVEKDDAKREKPLPKYFEMDRRIRYRVRSGDYLGKIAKRFGVRVSSIKRWNGLRSNNLRIGQRLSIYPRRFRKVRKSTKKISSEPKGKYEIYTVKEGDSLWTISKKYPSISIDQIKKWNNIWSVTKLKPGMKLKIFKS
ncbi:Lytic murein transglycosylase, family GH23, CBM50 precursor [Tenacibaculum sp. 190524A02b]|uniref:lytic transglycosylase domain-containing protein n=1 Tax=Tenacibaculum vairaonense TaxID=3137860 RepID=UPI0032B2DFCC